MLNYIQTLIILCLVSCQSSTSSQKGADKNHDSVTSVTTPKSLNENLKDTTGFLSDCQKWSSGAYEGYLQGVEASKDSLGDFCFYECYDCKETFQIILVHKTQRGNDTDNSVWNEFENSCGNQYANFNCFAFVYPMRDPDKQKDVHAMNVDFPVTVRAYERTNGDSWRFLKKVRAKNFHALSLLQFKTIYHLQ